MPRHIDIGGAPAHAECAQLGQTENFDPPAPFPDGPQGAVSQPNVSRPSASVSTFGGPGDGNGQ